jgi:hypothetical protein
MARQPCGGHLWPWHRAARWSCRHGEVRSSSGESSTARSTLIKPAMRRFFVGVYLLKNEGFLDNVQWLVNKYAYI